ncbi:MAG: hypothetical protein PVH61_31700 [Candidatus Aminicenantes bacterium]|jgi:hypothetical protein
MFEKIKRGVSKVKGNVEKARAKSRSMSVAEYREEQLELKELRKKKEKELRKLEIEQSFERKKKRVIHNKGRSGVAAGLTGGLDLVTGIGKNVLRNIDDSPTGSFNRALTGGSKSSSTRKSSKKKGKKRKPRRVVTEYY